MSRFSFIKQVPDSKRFLLTCVFISFLSFFATQTTAQKIYQNRQASVEQRVNDLLSRMTLEEKILQLNQLTAGLNTNPNNIENKMREIPAGIGSLILFSPDPLFRNRIQKKAMDSSRLGIPILFGFDVIHGFRTLYPIPLAQACSWNPELVRRAAEMAAREARMSGTDWTF